MFKDMSKIMTWYVWMVTYLCRNVNIVCGPSYHLLRSQISQDSEIRFQLQVKSYTSNWRFNKSRHSSELCFSPYCHGLWQIRRVRLLAGYPYCSCTWQIVTQMGHVSPGDSPHGHHSGPWCTALLSSCIYNARTRVEGCSVSTSPLRLPIFFCPFKWAFPSTYIECRKSNQ